MMTKTRAGASFWLSAALVVCSALPSSHAAFTNDETFDGLTEAQQEEQLNALLKGSELEGALNKEASGSVEVFSSDDLEGLFEQLLNQEPSKLPMITQVNVKDPRVEETTQEEVVVESPMVLEAKSSPIKETEMASENLPLADCDEEEVAVDETPCPTTPIVDQYPIKVDSACDDESETGTGISTPSPSVTSQTPSPSAIAQTPCPTTPVMDQYPIEDCDDDVVDQYPIEDCDEDVDQFPIEDCDESEEEIPSPAQSTPVPMRSTPTPMRSTPAPVPSTPVPTPAVTKNECSAAEVQGSETVDEVIERFCQFGTSDTLPTCQSSNGAFPRAFNVDGVQCPIDFTIKSGDFLQVCCRSLIVEDELIQSNNLSVATPKGLSGAESALLATGAIAAVCALAGAAIYLRRRNTLDEAMVVTTPAENMI